MSVTISDVQKFSANRQVVAAPRRSADNASRSILALISDVLEARGFMKVEAFRAAIEDVRPLVSEWIARRSVGRDGIQLEVADMLITVTVEYDQNAEDDLSVIDTRLLPVLSPDEPVFVRFRPGSEVQARHQEGLDKANAVGVANFSCVPPSMEQLTDEEGEPDETEVEETPAGADENDGDDAEEPVDDP